MKKMLALVMCAVLCVTLAGCSSESPKPAQSTTASVPTQETVPQSISVKLEDVTAVKGSTISVAATVTAHSSIAAADFDVGFDETVLEYVSYQKGNVVAGGINNGACTKKGNFHFTMATLTEVEEAGELFVVTFKVREDAPEGATPLTLACTTCCDYDVVALDITCHDGSITVK